MKILLTKLFALLVVALLAAPVFADDGPPGDGPQGGERNGDGPDGGGPQGGGPDGGGPQGGGGDLAPPIREIDNSIRELGLNDDQKGKYEQIYKQHVPVLQKQYEEQQQVFTPDQKAKRQEAIGKAKKQGLQGKEYEQFVQSSVKLSPQQSKQYTDYDTDLKKSQSKFREEVYQILTPDQQEKFPKVNPKKGSKNGKQPPKNDPKQGGKEDPKQGGKPDPKQGGKEQPKQGQPQKQGGPDKKPVGGGNGPQGGNGEPKPQ